MALKPMLIDYVALIMQRFKQFMQHHIQQQDIKQAKSLT